MIVCVYWGSNKLHQHFTCPFSHHPGTTTTILFLAQRLAALKARRYTPAFVQTFYSVGEVAFQFVMNCLRGLG